MRSRSAALVLGLALSLAPLAAHAQQATVAKDTTHHAVAKTHASKMHATRRHVKQHARRHVAAAARRDSVARRDSAARMGHASRGAMMPAAAQPATPSPKASPTTATTPSRTGVRPRPATGARKP